MEEGKKKKRPTQAQIREMEDTIHRQCQELNAWRDNYHRLKNRGFWARVFNK